MSERQLLFEGFPYCQSPGLGSLRADASLCAAAFELSPPSLVDLQCAGLRPWFQAFLASTKAERTRNESLGQNDLLEFLVAVQLTT